jgi:hypothetical protein
MGYLQATATASIISRWGINDNRWNKEEDQTKYERSRLLQNFGQSLWFDNIVK